MKFERFCFGAGEKFLFVLLYPHVRGIMNSAPFFSKILYIYICYIFYMLAPKILL